MLHVLAQRKAIDKLQQKILRIPGPTKSKKNNPRILSALLLLKPDLQHVFQAFRRQDITGLARLPIWLFQLVSIATVKAGLMTEMVEAYPYIILKFQKAKTSFGVPPRPHWQLILCKKNLNCHGSWKRFCFQLLAAKNVPKTSCRISKLSPTFRNRLSRHNPLLIHGGQGLLRNWCLCIQASTRVTNMGALKMQFFQSSPKKRKGNDVMKYCQKIILFCAAEKVGPRTISL